MNPRSLSILLLISWVYSWTSTGHLAAQQLEPFFYNYNTDDGLPSSECYEIIQDQQGYIWVSTDNGVSRFNGEEFTNFGTEEGLTDKTILFMHEDHRGWIWMSSLNGNLFIYRGDSITAYRHNHLLQDIREEFYLISDFIIDSTGSLYLSLLHRGLAKISPEGVFSTIEFPYKDQGTASLFIQEDRLLVLDRSKRIPSAEEHELQRRTFNKKNKINRPFIIGDQLIPNPLPFDFESSTQDGFSSQFYAALFDNSMLLRNKDHLYWYPEKNNINYYQEGTTTNKQFTSIIRDQETQGFYVGYHNSGDGLSYFQNLDDLLQDRPLYNILQEHTITHLYQGSNGELWVGTLENGIYFMPNPRNLILKNSTQFVFSAICSWKDQQILSASTKGKILKISADFQISRHSQLRSAKGGEGLYRFVDSPTELVGLNPLQFWENDNWKFPKDDDPQRQSTNDKRGPLLNLRALVPANDSRYWWGLKSGTGLLKLVAKLEDNIPIITEQRLLPNKQVTCLVDQQNHLWIGTRTGLLRYDKTTQQTLTLGEHPILQERVEDITALSDTLIAVATRGSGLYFIGPGSLTIWNHTQGLASNAISFVRKDGDLLWFGSKNGLHRVLLSEGLSSLYIFTKKDGLVGNEILDILPYNDFAWVLTKGGLTKINKKVPERKGAAPFFVSNFTVNGQPHDIKEVPNLNWKDNNVQLRFQFLSFQLLKDKQYRFRLQPETPWIYRNTNTLDLLNLGSKDYQLEIEARDKWGKWVAMAPIHFSVLPPFWQTTWFFLSCLVLSLVILYFLFRQRLRNLTREKERLALHEEVSQLKQQAYRAQMNPHFIFNCLSTLQGMVVGDSTDQNRAVRMIANFSQLIRYSLEASRRDKVSLQDEIGLLRRYLLLEQQRFNNCFHFDIQVDTSLDVEWTEIPPMLVQPYAENAVLHGMEGKDGDGYILIQYQREGERLRVNIQDNGPGIYTTQAYKAANPSKLRHRSAGMTITQKRLAILNNIEDYQVDITETKNELGKSTGTCISILV